MQVVSVIRVGIHRALLSLVSLLSEFLIGKLLAKGKK
jgi:hypothetical protein